jgi:hypothetical protein
VAKPPLNTPWCFLLQPSLPRWLSHGQQPEVVQAKSALCSTTSLMAFFNVQILPHKDDSGQATVEFALLLPLFVTCIGVLIATTALSLSSLRLADTARTAARIASTSNDPQAAVSSYIAETGVDSRVALDDQRQFLTVSVAQRIRLPLIGIPIPLVRISSRITVMYEGIPTLLG